MKENKDNIVKFTLDPNNLPALTTEEQAELAAIAALPESAIDYSDAPELPEAIWQIAKTHVVEPKRQITLRIDGDVIDFFKDTGRRYQTRINAVLRAYVEAQKKAHG